MKKVIYQFGSLAGWPFVIAEGLRKRGIPSINVMMNLDDSAGTASGKSKRALRYDEYISHIRDGKIVRTLKGLLFVFRVLYDGKLVHYHGGTILYKNLDALIFRIFRVPTIITWGGGDARIIEVAVKNNPYFCRFEEPQRDARIRAMLKRLSRCKVTVVTDAEMSIYMKGFFKKTYDFKQPINLNELFYKEPSINKPPMLLHIPTHPFLKGTVHVKSAIDKLKKDGLNFTAEILDAELSQAEMRKKISECDIYIDELRVGSYGYTAIEAAGSGKPTLTYITKTVISKLPNELPFVISNADNIYDNLKYLIENPQERERIGKASRAYIEKYHDAQVVLDNLIKLYNNLLGE